MKKGYVHIYTGDGKGKTTAALGLALRARGHKMRVFIGQFMKGQHYGELSALDYLPGIDVQQFGDIDCIRRDQVTDFHIGLARQGVDRIFQVYGESRYDMVILDEIIVAVWFGLIPEDKVVELIQEKPDTTELILTGRKATGNLMKYGDLITEMKEIRHYYNTLGILSRKGIEN